MQISNTKRIIAILTIVFLNANTTISNEIYQIDYNNTQIIDESNLKKDNVYIDSYGITNTEDGLVMNKNISNDKNPQLTEGTITKKCGVLSVINETTPIPSQHVTSARVLTNPKPIEVITNAHKAKISEHSKDLINTDLVINYAAIDSDMNINGIKTNGKVILMVNPETNIDNKPFKQYNMVSVNSSADKNNFEENGISLTSSGKKEYIKDDEIAEEIKIHNLSGASISIERLEHQPIQQIDRRESLRFKLSDLANPVILNHNSSDITKLIDISRGGVAIQHNNLKVGNILPICLKYKDLQINTNIQILSTKDKHASAKFVNNDKATDDQLLYLSVLLESDNNMLKTRLSK